MTDEPPPVRVTVKVGDHAITNLPVLALPDRPSVMRGVAEVLRRHAVTIVGWCDDRDTVREMEEMLDGGEAA